MRQATRPGACEIPAATRTVRSPLERPAPLRQAVYDVLVEMIITRELQPGEHLVENELAAQLGVSRQPVREALQRMQSEGWVDLRPALGAFVHIPTDDEADQLLAVRTLLEAESARLAAKRATPEQVEHLWELQRTGEKALADGRPGRSCRRERRAARRISSLCPATRFLPISSGRSTVGCGGITCPLRRRAGRTPGTSTPNSLKPIARRSARRAGDLMRRHTERTREIYHEQRHEAAEGIA